MEKNNVGLRRRGRAWLVCALAGVALASASVLVVAAEGSGAELPGRARVALVAASTQATAGQVLDLALVELTTRGEVDLIEREAITAVLREQAFALTEAEAGLRMGQLLRADLVGVLDASPEGQDLGGIVVLDSASGAVFANVGLAGLKAPEAAELVANAVSDSAKKRALPADQRNTVCLLGARNSEFARSKDVFCEMVAYLVERRLLLAPNVTTLERRRLDAVLKENRLPGSEEPKALLPSLRLLELDFRRGAKDGDMKVVLRLSDAKGNAVATAEVQGLEEATRLVNLVGSNVCALLRVSAPTPVGHPAAEAARFRRQAEYLAKRNLVEAEVQALSAAYALDPGSRAEQLDYVGKVATFAAAEAKAQHYRESLALVEQALDLMAVRKIVLQPSWRALGAAIGLSAQGAPDASPEKSQAAALRQRFLDLLGLTGDCGKGPYMTVPGFQFDLLAVAELCRDGAMFCRLLDCRLAACLEREHTPTFKHAGDLPEKLLKLTGGAEHWTREFYADIPFDAPFVAGVKRAVAKMRDHPRAVVRLEGRLGELYCDIAAKKIAGAELSRPEALAGLSILVRDAGVAASEATTPTDDIPFCYAVAVHAVQAIQAESLYPSRAESQAAAAALLRAALANKHLVKGVLAFALEQNKGPFETAQAATAGREVFARYTAPLIEPLLAAMADKSVRRIDVTEADLTRMLEPLRAYRPQQQEEVPVRPATLIWTAPLAPRPGQFLAVLAREGEGELYALSAWAQNYVPNDGSPFALHRIQLVSGRSDLVATGRISSTVNWLTESMLPSQLNYEYISDAARDPSGCLYLATPGDGIRIVCPGEVPLVRRLGLADGLPSDVVQSLAVVSNVLYAALGDASTSFVHTGGEQEKINYFVCYNLAASTCEVIASTGRAKAETPWDSLSNGFWIRAIIPDEARGRLLIVLNAGDTRPENGLWEYRLAERTFRPLLRLERGVRQVVPAHDGSLWLLSFIANTYRPVHVASPWSGLIRFDPVAESGRLVGASRALAAGPQLPMEPDTRILDVLEKGLVCPVLDWLYYFRYGTASGQSRVEVHRVSLLTGRDDLVDVSDFGPMGKWGYLHWLPEAGLLLVGNGHELRALRPNHDRSAHAVEPSADSTRSN